MLKGDRYEKEDFERVYWKLFCDKPLESQYNDHFLVSRTGD